MRIGVTHTLMVMGNWGVRGRGRWGGVIVVVFRFRRRLVLRERSRIDSLG